MVQYVAKPLFDELFCPLCQDTPVCIWSFSESVVHMSYVVSRIHINFRHVFICKFSTSDTSMSLFPSRFSREAPFHNQSRVVQQTIAPSLAPFKHEIIYEKIHSSELFIKSITFSTLELRGVYIKIGLDTSYYTCVADSKNESGLCSKIIELCYMISVAASYYSGKLDRK